MLIGEILTETLSFYSKAIEKELFARGVPEPIIQRALGDATQTLLVEIDKELLERDTE